MNIYEANKTMQLIGQQSASETIADETARKGFLDIIKAHQDNNSNDIYSVALDTFIYGVIAGKREARQKNQEKCKRIIEEHEKAVIMDNSKIGELATTWSVPKDLLETVMQHVQSAINEEPAEAQKMALIDKIQYMCDDAYKQGILTALYVFNETYKKALEQLKAEI